MCEFSRKLIAWLDRELPVDEGLEVELHLGACSDCRQELRTYERLSSALDTYCDEAMESSAPRNEPSWKPAALGAGAVAAVFALLLASPHVRKTQTPTGATQGHAPTSLVAERVPPRSDESQRGEAIKGSSTAARRKGAPRWRSLQPAGLDSLLANLPKPTDRRWLSAEPAIQITIPADAVLPPGAAPEGVSFVAEVSIAPDGSAHQIFLQR